jgi:hypothetical protein
MQPNPKQDDSWARELYQRYMHAKTLGEEYSMHLKQLIDWTLVSTYDIANIGLGCSQLDC